MDFNNLSDFWDSFEEKEVIETLWNIYNDMAEEKRDLLKAVNESKSIRTVPYEIKKRWKKFRFQKMETGFKCLTETGDDVLVDIPSVTSEGKPNIVDESLEPVDIELSPVLPLEQDVAYVTRLAQFSVGMKLYEETDGYPAGTTITEEMEDLGEVRVKNRYVINLEGDFEGEYKNLWVKEYYIHNPLIINYHSEIVDIDDSIYNVNIYSEQFLNMIKALWYILVQGPTMHNLKVGVLLFLGLPVSLETDLEIEIYEPGHVKLSNGDEWEFPENFPLATSYREGQKRYPIYGEGQVIPRFTPLIDNVHLFDYVDEPEYEGVITSPGREDIEKYSTLAVRVSDDLFETDYIPDATLVENFLESISPQYLLFDVLWNFIVRAPWEYEHSFNTYMKLAGKIHPVFKETAHFVDEFNGDMSFNGEAWFNGRGAWLNPINHHHTDRVIMTAINKIMESNRFEGILNFDGQANFDGEPGPAISHFTNALIRQRPEVSPFKKEYSFVTRIEDQITSTFFSATAEFYDEHDGGLTFEDGAYFDGLGRYINPLNHIHKTKITKETIVDAYLRKDFDGGFRFDGHALFDGEGNDNKFLSNLKANIANNLNYETSIDNTLIESRRINSDGDMDFDGEITFKGQKELYEEVL